MNHKKKTHKEAIWVEISFQPFTTTRRRARLFTSACLLLQGQVRTITSILIHRPTFHKVFMPGVNERTCGFPRVSTLAPVSAVSESLIAVALWDRQACAKTMASKSWRLTATDSHLPPKHTSGPLRFLSLPPFSPLSICLFSFCRGKLRRRRDKESDVVNWHLSSCFVLVRALRTFVKF